MLKRRAIALSLILSLLSLPIFSQQSEPDGDIRARIRKEGKEHSQIIRLSTLSTPGTQTWILTNAFLKTM